MCMCAWVSVCAWCVCGSGGGDGGSGGEMKSHRGQGTSRLITSEADKARAITISLVLNIWK